MTAWDSPLLRLPLELRRHVYTHLLPRENISHPLPSVGITSVSHRPPCLALLTVHPQLTEEILDYYYSLATWKLIISHAFNFFRVDPDLSRLAASPSLASIRKVEVVFFCDILLLKEYPSFGLSAFCAEIRRRADRACQVLAAAPKLNAVTVSWIDTTNTGGWAEKANVLLPLRRLQDRVSFQIGDINGPETEDEQKVLLKSMKDVLRAVKQEQACAKASRLEEPARLRMLAFDVRQERPNDKSKQPLPQTRWSDVDDIAKGRL